MLEASSQHTQTLGPAPALRRPGHDEGKDGMPATLMHVSLHRSLDTFAHRLPLREHRRQADRLSDHTCLPGTRHESQVPIRYLKSETLGGAGRPLVSKLGVTCGSSRSPDGSCRAQPCARNRQV